VYRTAHVGLYRSPRPAQPLLASAMSVWYLSMTIGTEALREGCGGGGNAFPVCGMWAPIADDSQGHAWHTCFRAIVKQTNGNSWDLSAKQLGVDMPDCGKKFLVDDGTIQYGPFMRL